MELINDGHNGILTHLNDPERFGEQLLELIQAGPGEWNKFGSNGMQTLIDNHSKDNVVRSYLDLYDRLQKYP
jgi:glycosyltransferase involved in cell wall biosynthesis